MISSVLLGRSTRKEELFLLFIICYLLSAKGSAQHLESPASKLEILAPGGSVHRILFSLLVEIA